MEEPEHQTSDVELPAAPPEGGQTGSYASDAIVDLLHTMGTKYVALNPGSSFRGLHDSLVNHGGNRAPQLLLCLHEEIAVSLAHGYAKASNDLAVAAVHDLVGLMHASMAVYDAFCDRTPVLLLGGSGPSDPAQRRPVDWTHSATTQAQLVRDFVVWDAEPATPAASVSDVVRARQRALSAPRGPAYVSLDAGVQEAELAVPLELPDLALHAPAPPIGADPAAVVRAAEMLAAAENPVVVAGRVGLDVRATAALVELVELLGAAYRDDRNTVAFPTAHAQNATGDEDLLREADVVLAVDVVDLPALVVSPSRGARDAEVERPGTRPLLIDLSHGDLGLRSWSNALAAPVERSVQLLADPLLGLAQLTRALESRVDARAATVRRETVHRRVAALKARQWAAVEERWDDDPIAPSRLVAETWHAVRDIDHLLCLRNTRTWPEGVWKFPGAGSYLGHSGGGGVGYGPGSFVGGALAARDRGQLGVGIIGDGDLLMAAGALWTAVHYRIPMLVVINDNSSFYNDEPHQAAVARRRGRPPGNSWIGMRITDPPVDLAGLARSYGCWAADTVTDPVQLDQVLAEATGRAQAGAVAVVHVQTAPR